MTTKLDVADETCVGVVGYRDFDDYEMLRKELDLFGAERKIDLIVSGGCRGADQLAEKYADHNNIPKQIYPPDLRLGKMGYAKRNQQIVDRSTHLIAFLSKKSLGTLMTIQMAKRKKIPVKIINVD